MSPVDKGSPESKISGLLRSNGYQRLRGTMHIETRPDGRLIMKAWPKKRGPNTDPDQHIRQQQFAARQYYASNPLPEDAAMARSMTKGSPFLYRDILYKQQVGQLVEATTTDGTQYLSWRLTLADAQQMLDSISADQGVMLYRNATKWVALPPGNPGQVLTESPSTGLPAWIDPTGGGGGAPAPFFDPPLAAIFTAGNGLVMTDNAGGLVLTRAAASSQLAYGLKPIVAPTAAFTAYMRISPDTFEANNTCGIIFRNASNGKSISIFVAPVTNLELSAQFWTNDTTPTSELGNNTQYMKEYWLKLHSDGAGHVSCFASNAAGATWRPLGSASTLLTGGPTHVGVALAARNTSIPPAAVVDYYADTDNPSSILLAGY